MKTIILSGKVRGSALKFIPPKKDGGTKTVQAVFVSAGGIHTIDLKVSDVEPVDAKDYNFPVDIADGELYEIEIRMKPIARAEQTSLPLTGEAKKSS